MEASVREWKTEMWLCCTEGDWRTGKVAVKLGIFQCHYLSPLLFYSTLVPLTNMLNKQGAEYEVKGKNKVRYLFCIDDLKLFSKDESELKHLVMTYESILAWTNTPEQFSSMAS
jgi:hypothetical protein